MLSVLFEYTAGKAGFRTHGPAIGLFAGQEIKLIKGPLFLGHPPVSISRRGIWVGLSDLYPRPKIKNIVAIFNRNILIIATLTDAENRGFPVFSAEFG